MTLCELKKLVMPNKKKAVTILCELQWKHVLTVVEIWIDKWYPHQQTNPTENSWWDQISWPHGQVRINSDCDLMILHSQLCTCNLRYTGVQWVIDSHQLNTQKQGINFISLELWRNMNFSDSIPVACEWQVIQYISLVIRQLD